MYGRQEDITPPVQSAEEAAATVRAHLGLPAAPWAAVRALELDGAADDDECCESVAAAKSDGCLRCQGITS